MKLGTSPAATQESNKDHEEAAQPAPPELAPAALHKPPRECAASQADGLTATGGQGEGPAAGERKKRQAARHTTQTDVAAMQTIMQTDERHPGAAATSATRGG